MLEAVLFDVDGILVDSEELYYRAVQETFAPYGVEISVDEYVRIWMMEQSGTSGLIAERNLTIDLNEILTRKSEIVRRLFAAELELMPHARELIEYMHERYPLGVVSSSNRRDLNAKLNKFNLLDRFGVVITCEDVSKGKPDPEPYQRGVSLMQKRASNILVIEDSQSGVESAKGAGCIVIAYPNKYTESMDFSQADAIVKSLRDINEDLLQRLF